MRVERGEWGGGMGGGLVLGTSCVWVHLLNFFEYKLSRKRNIKFVAIFQFIRIAGASTGAD